VIAHLRGRVAHRGPTSVVVDVAGVGYLVHVAPTESVPPRGEDVELHTSLQVREDAMTLYGFRARASLELFEVLLSSSGVGPKLALAALGTHRPDVLRTAIAGGDLATLTAIPGVGKKVAERLVLELKDKVGAIVPVAAAGVAEGDVAGAVEPGTVGEVRDALLALGYSAAEVTGTLAALTADGVPAAGEDATSALLRQALRTLGQGRGSGSGS
jgi:Holliday junction DNA helicase RuvA